jgi:hypothetical protein
MGNAGLGEGGAIHLHFQLWDKGGTLINPAGVILDSSNQPNKANLKTIGNPQSVGSGF